MLEFLANLLKRFLLQFVVLGVIATIGLPFLVFYLRPDLDFAYHLAGPEEISVDAKNFSNKVRNNAFAAVVGSIDPERSSFIVGFTQENLLVKLKGFPNNVGIHVNQPFMKRNISREYAAYRNDLPDARKLITSFGDTVFLNEFLSQDNPLLAQEHTFSGRLYDISGGKLKRYSKGDELGGTANNLNWLVVDQETPSLGFLVNTNALPFLFLLGLVTFIGLPVLLIMLAANRSKRLDRKAEIAVRRNGTIDELEPSRRIAPLLSRRERIDSPSNQELLDQRLRNFLRTPRGKALRDQFSIPLWIRYVGFLLSFIVGLLALPTIVFSRAGVRLLWSIICLEPLRDMGGKQLDARLRIIITSLITVEPPVPTREGEEGRALVLGTLDADENFGLGLQSAIAGNLQRILREGPRAVEEQEIYGILCNAKSDGLFRRRAVPRSIAEHRDLMVFVCQLSANDCYTPPEGHTLVAYVIDPEHDGEMHSLPWSVIADLIKEQ